MKWSFWPKATFFGLLFVAPPMENFIFGSLIGKLEFPIGKVSAAVSIFPKLKTNFNGLSKLYSIDLAREAVLLHANLLLMNLVALLVFSSVFTIYLLRIGYSISLIGNATPLRQASKNLAVCAVMVIFSIYVVFFLPTFVIPVPGSWQGRPLSAERSTPWAISWFLNLWSLLLICAVFGFFRSLRESRA